ncbi:MAG: cbb3-type cytochrome oxidase assembly protein CcoS [Bacteroidota bacterium]
MSVILILLAASLTIAIGFLLAFIWSVKNGQYDDDYTPSVRMLFENDIQNSQQVITGSPSVPVSTNAGMENKIKKQTE